MEKIKKTKDILLENHTKAAEVLGFWNEEYKRTVLRMLETNYAIEIIRVRFIEDVIINGDKVLIKWGKKISGVNR
jgi:hypothetical protein